MAVGLGDAHILGLPLAIVQAELYCGPPGDEEVPVFSQHTPAFNTSHLLVPCHNDA